MNLTSQSCVHFNGIIRKGREVKTKKCSRTFDEIDF